MASIVAKIIGDATDFDKKVTGAKTTLNSFKTALGKIGIGLGMTAILGWFSTLIKEGSRLTDVAQKLGVTTDFLQEFSYAATQNGLAVNTAEMGLQRFTRRLGEAVQGKGELLPILEQYDVQLKNIDGTTRSAEEVMRDMADIIKETKDPAERLRIAFKMLDSEGVGLINVLQQGTAGFDEFAAAAHNAGLVISEDALKNMDQLSDEMQTFWQWTKKAGTELLGNFVDGINKARSVVSTQLLPDQRDLDISGYEEIAERIIRHENTIVNLRIKNSKTFRDHVEIGGEMVKLSDAIAHKAQELYYAERNANLEMQNRATALGELNAQKEEEINTATQALALNQQISEYITEAATTLGEKMLPAQERSALLAKKIADLSMLANDESQTEEARVAAAKQLVKLLGEQQTLVQKIGEEKQKEYEQEQKKTAELDKQAAKLMEQKEALEQQTAALRAQFQEFEESRYDPTFQDYLSGVGGGVRQRSAENYSSAESELTAAIARGSSGEILDDYIRRLDIAKEDFTRLTGQNPSEANPFKAALEKSEQELEKQTAQLETL
jgi:hypothetical protein